MEKRPGQWTLHISKLQSRDGHDHGDTGHWTVETHILIDLQPSCLLLYVDRSQVQAAESTNKHTNRVDYHARYGAGGAGGLQEPRGATEETFIVTAFRS